MKQSNAKLSETGQTVLQGKVQTDSEIYVEPTKEFMHPSSDKFYDIYKDGKYIATMHWLCFYDYTGEW